MEITTVEELENGYLVNGSMVVPDDVDNRHYKLIKEFELNGGVIAPYTPVEVPVDLKALGEEYADTGVTVPFKSADALAVMQIERAFARGETSTNLLLSNGQVLALTPVTFEPFANWFVNKRNAFFK